MRAASFIRGFVVGLLSCSIAACGDNIDVDGDAPLPVEVTVKITADVAPALVVIREGLQGPWRAANSLTTTTFEAEVTQFYTVLAVCPEALGAGVQVSSRALRDDAKIVISCALPPDTFTVTGTMAQPGMVTLDGVRRTGTQPNWSFDFQVGAGTYDLIAVTGDRVAVQRGIDVAADVTLPAPIDVALQGTALVDTAFTITNAVQGETTEIGVFMVTPHNQPQARLYLGPLTTAKVAPDSVLAFGEQQEVSVRSMHDDGTRSVTRTARRPFRAGSSTAFTLWNPFADFRFVVEQGALAATWTTRSEVSYLFFQVYGAVGSVHSFDFSRNYLSSTRRNRLELEIGDVPGFDPRWRLDLTQEYVREMSADLRTIDLWGMTFNERVNAAGSSTLRRAPDRATP